MRGAEVECTTKLGGGGWRGASVGAVLLGFLALTSGCGSNRSSPEQRPAASVPGDEPGTAPGGTSSAAPVDTLRGTVAIVGAEPLTQVVLRPAAGGAEVVLLGNLIPELRRVAGAEVWIAGRGAEEEAGRAGTAAPGARAFQVQRFEVRAVDGVPAVDGVLVVIGDVAYLRVPGGAELRIAHLPSALRGQSGARVWLSGRLDGDIEAFGVIREAGENRK